MRCQPLRRALEVFMFKNPKRNSEIIETYFLETLSSIKLLQENRLQTQALIIIMSAIDAFGLLNAPVSETKSSSRTFKSWADKYICSDPEIEYTSEELWGYRCSLLHTFTMSSDLSKSGKIKEIIFYSGSKSSPKVGDLKDFSANLPKHHYVIAHIETTVVVFAKACQLFSRELDSKSRESQEVNERLAHILSRTHF